MVRELLRELALRDDPHEYLLYARTAWEEPQDPRFTWALHPAADPWWNLHAARRASAECDVFLSSNSYLTTWALSVPGVPIVHDLIAFDPAMRPNARSAWIERVTLGPAVRTSKLLLANSQATADALTARFPAARGRTVVARFGVAPTLAAAPDPAEAAELPAPGFVLAVGTLEPRKNLPRLVEAYGRLPEVLQQAHPLAVVGALGWETGETLEALRSLGDRAHVLGHVSDRALAELYRRCAVFAFPSLGEGFGLPVLEAMGAGAAVLTSDVSSLPEVGGDAVAYADPRDVGALAAALQRLLEDPGERARLGAAGEARAAEFSWARFAAETLSVLEQAAA